MLFLPSRLWIYLYIFQSALGADAADTYVAGRQKVKGTPKVIANVTDPSVSRDSCGSVKIGHRILWTCRDTMAYDRATNSTKFPIITNSASWTDLTADGAPDIVHNAPIGVASNGTNPVLLMYGGNPTSYPPFYPVSKHDCFPGGFCHNGTRYAIWPDSPPVISETAANGTVIGYTWIRKFFEENLKPIYPEQPYTLYKVTYAPTADNQTLPKSTVVDEAFWTEDQWGYGDFGNLVVGQTLYLWGHNQNHTAIALAKVGLNDIEDKSKYLYYVGGKWTTTMPALNDSAASVEYFSSAKQGTFYYSKALGSYVWIGGIGEGSNANFMMTTASSPEGPWMKPYLIYAGQVGDGKFPAYSLQAHPDLLQNPSEKAIYLTWTQTFKRTTYPGYITPLVYLEFE